MRVLKRNDGNLFGALLLIAMFMHDSPAWALEETSVHHTMWVTDGLGAVFDIQQAGDGYLWLTTSTGVFRFDGVRFQSVEEATNGAVQNSEIHAFFLSASGGVWLVTRAAGLDFWKDGQLISYSDRRCTPVLQTGGIAEDGDGSLWLQTRSGLFHMTGAVCEQIGAQFGYPGGFPAALLVDSANTVWVRTLAGELLYMPHGQSRFRRLDYAAGPASDAFVFTTATHNIFLHESPDRIIWLSDGQGLRPIANLHGELPPSSLMKAYKREDIQLNDFAFGADGEIWAGSDRGLQRFGDIDPRDARQSIPYFPGNHFTTEQGLSSNVVWKVFIDSEGNVWTGTNSGLDRLRHTALSSLVLPATQEHDFSIVADRQNAIWIGNRDLALIELTPDGRMTSFPMTRGTICLRIDRQGTIWSATYSGATLWHSSRSGFSPMQYPEDEVGHIISLAMDRMNDLWISTATGGTYRLRAGVWEKQNDALGKKPGILGAMTGDEQGNIWFGYSNNVARWDGSRYDKFTFPVGGRGVSVTTMFVRGDRVWIGGFAGVQLFVHGQFRIPQWQNHDFPGRVSGVIETTDGDLWTNGSSGVTHVPASELTHWLRDPTHPLSAERFDALDGLPGFSGERIPEPSLAQSKDGRLWFATSRGIAWLDPTTLHQDRNPMRPPVIISSIVSSGKTYRPSGVVTLPSHTERIEIDYTALSFTIPERVLFRYKLEGIDSTWQDAGTRRQAYYTRLPPGQYRFRVLACNNDGIWNMEGDQVSIVITPAFYQTIWFRIAMTCIGCLAIWMVFRMRLRAATALVESRLNDRLLERERIARDLHDTFFQGIQGLLLMINTAVNRLREEEPTRLVLKDALRRSDQVMAEGRQLVLDLRAESNAGAPLSDALALAGSEFKEVYAVPFSISVVGIPEELHPIVYEEMYRLAREAIWNSFQHANASSIEVQIVYEKTMFRLIVRDDGVGLDANVLSDGKRRHHWGLPGMRERAKKIGAVFTLRSSQNAGTEIEIKISAAVAYRRRPTRLWYGWARNCKDAD